MGGASKELCKRGISVQANAWRTYVGRLHWLPVRQRIVFKKEVVVGPISSRRSSGGNYRTSVHVSDHCVRSAVTAGLLRARSESSNLSEFVYCLLRRNRSTNLASMNLRVVEKLATHQSE